MELVKSKVLTIVDKANNQWIELKSIKQLENWNEGKIEQINLPSHIKALFDEIERCIRESDIKSIKKSEDEIRTHGLKIQETDECLTDIQFGRNNKIYFKTA